MAFVNYYNCKNASGTTLTDSIGTNNGTLAGASLPTINANGYLSFLGGHHTTQGNWSRVLLVQSDFNYTNQQNFTIIIKFKSTWAEGTTKSAQIFATGYRNDSPGDIRLQYNTNINSFAHYSKDSNSKRKVAGGVHDPSVGGWHISIRAYSANDMVYYLDNASLALAINEAMSPTYNFYAASGLATLGAGLYDNSPNFIYDFTGDIEYFGNRNDKMSIGEAKTYSDYLTGAIQN